MLKNAGHRYRIEELNGMDGDTFVAALGGLFEDSPWVASEAFAHRPFPSANALIECMCDCVRAAGGEKQLALLRAHPELGADAKMAAASVQEQQGAGIHAGEAVQRQQLADLNARYRAKFGFPFIVAVRGMSLAGILENLQQRLGNDRDTEFNECLRQVCRIARLRLDTRLAED